jgi:hypothetical protein
MGINGTVGPQNSGENRFGEYDFSDHELDNPRLTLEEERHLGDPRFEADF